MFWTSDGEIYNEEELTEKVKNSVKFYREQYEKLREEVKEWRENATSKINEELLDENEFLREQLALSYGQFASQKEKDAYEKFEKRHMHERSIFKINGGCKPYLIPTQVGIGTNLIVKCPICGEEKNITDLEVW